MPSGADENAKQIRERLLRDRIVYLGGKIDSSVAKTVVGQLLSLEKADAAKPIRLYVTSPGGLFPESMMIFDSMGFIRVPIHTYCIGNADATAALIVAHGSEGFRYALTTSTFSVCECAARSDAVAAEELDRINNVFSSLLAADTGQFIEQVRADMKANRHFTATQALEYGLIDEILK